MNAHEAISSDNAVDPRQLRDVLGCFATGVTVITTAAEDGSPIGLVVNSFSSLSLDPPLVQWSIARQTPSYGAFRDHNAFAVNIMGADARDIALQFARPARNKFAGVRWEPGFMGVPLLSDALAFVECRTVDRLPGGDHEILVGQVQRCCSRQGDPLVFYRGDFATIGERL